MKDGYILLSNRYTIKGSKDEQVLFDLFKGTRYELRPGQFEFLSLCNGSFRLVEILNQYDEESQQVIYDFLVELEKVEAIQFTNEKVRRVLNNNFVSSPRLQAVHLEANSRCNMRCVHCYQGDIYPARDNLNLEEIYHLIDEMEEMQVESVSISGGEPFLDENTFDIIRYIENHDMRVSSIFTNGSLINESVVEGILDCRSNPTIFVSLDAVTSRGMKFRGFNEDVGKDVLNKIIRGIKILVSNKIRVVVNTVMNKYNIMDLREMHEVISSLKVNSWRIGFPKPTGFFKKRKELVLPWKTMMDASFDILKYHYKRGRPFHLQIEYLYRRELLEDFYLLSGDEFVCDYEGRRESCCVKPNGDITHCAYCTDISLGNIREKNLRRIWYSYDMQRIKNFRIKDVEECNNCEFRSYCATGCRINAYFLHGDFYHAKDDYACQAIKFFVENILPFLKIS